MKLGMSQACYRWLFYSDMRRDGPEYGRLGLPRPYLQTVVAPASDEAVQDWLIDKCGEFGFASLYQTTRWQGEPDRASSFRARMAAAGLQFIGNVNLNMAASEAEWWAGEHEEVVDRIRHVALGGGRLAATTHNQSLRHNHFTRDPGIEEQLRRAVHNVRSLVPACEEHGVVLALENHMDYRLSELVQVVEQVDSQWVRINLDTANPIGVIEDPLEGARKAARYAVNAHLKDMRVQPATGTGEPRVYWAPLGQGDVPIAEILALLQEEAPDPENLPACVEVAPPPDHDPDVWLRSSVDWLHEQCGEYFGQGDRP